MAYRAPLLSLFMLLLAGFALSCGGSINSRGASSNSELLFIADNCQCLYPLVRSLRLDTNTGKLTEVATPVTAQWARPLVIDPKGRFLYAGLIQTTAQAVLGYSIDGSTGQLSVLPGSPFTALNGSHDVFIDPSGSFLYADGTGFAIDRNTGTLTALSNSSGVAPWAITRQGIALSVNCPSITSQGTLSSYRIDSTGNLVNLANILFPAIPLCRSSRRPRALP